MLSDGARQWLENQATDSFMVPVAEYFTLHDAQLWISEGQDPSEATAGWYSRLSAPGYLDCTDWQGPYDSESEAFQALYDTYGDD